MVTITVHFVNVVLLIPSYVVVFVVDLAFVCECPPYQTRVCVCVWLCDDFLES